MATRAARRVLTVSVTRRWLLSIRPAHIVYVHAGFCEVLELKTRNLIAADMWTLAVLKYLPIEECNFLILGIFWG